MKIFAYKMEFINRNKLMDID